MAFNLGRITDAANRIRRDFTEFSRLWGDVREDWRDERCRKFEQEHLSSLGPALSRFSAELNEFCDAVRKAEQALQDDQRSGDGLE